jgi:hypothetical protein
MNEDSSAEYSTHSFRSGAATEAAARGATSMQLKGITDWKNLSLAGKINTPDTKTKTNF